MGAALDCLTEGLAGTDMATAHAGKWLLTGVIQLELIRLHFALGRTAEAQAIVQSIMLQPYPPQSAGALLSGVAELTTLIRTGNWEGAAACAERLGLSPSAYITPVMDSLYLPRGPIPTPRPC